MESVDKEIKQSVQHPQRVIQPIDLIQIQLLTAETVFLCQSLGQWKKMKAFTCFIFILASSEVTKSYGLGLLMTHTNNTCCFSQWFSVTHQVQTSFPLPQKQIWFVWCFSLALSLKKCQVNIKKTPNPRTAREDPQCHVLNAPSSNVCISTAI